MRGGAMSGRLATWCVLASALSSGAAWGQPPGAATNPTVRIEREALALNSPDSFRIPLQLDAVRSVRIAARQDGVVAAVSTESGKAIPAQGEILRLDATEFELEFARAKAEHRVAQIDLELATSGTDPKARERAEAKLEAARATADLAKHRLERAIVRAPFAGRLERLAVVAGQFVRAGETIATVVDPAQLQVEIPVDRGATTVGAKIEISVEGKAVQGTVRELLPLAERFGAVRELLSSAASAIVVVDNASGTQSVGQSVRTPLLPQHPIAVVKNSLVVSGSEGRKVQVLRDDTIRDVPIEVLAAAGTDRTYVTGPFATKDELVLSASAPLADGTVVSPTVGGPRGTRPGGPSNFVTPPGSLPRVPQGPPSNDD